MKKVILRVEIEVDDDYILDDADWLLEDAVAQGEYEYNVSLLKDKK